MSAVRRLHRPRLRRYGTTPTILKTWKHVATPPDIKPRAHVGNWGDLSATSTAECT